MLVVGVMFISFLAVYIVLQTHTKPVMLLSYIRVFANMLKYLVLINFYFTLINCQTCNEVVLNKVLNSFENGLNYVLQNKDKMNIDAMFAFVLAEANIKGSKSKEDLPQVHLNRLNGFEQTLLNVTSQVHVLAQQNPTYQLLANTLLIPEVWNRNVAFQDKLLEVSHHIKADTFRQFYDYVFASQLREEASDFCFEELLKHSPRCCKEHRCNASMHCVALMGLLYDQPLERGYGATHCLLYRQVAISQKCQVNLKLVNKSILNYCSYIYMELKKNAEFNFYHYLDDLLFEQVTLCGYEGFTEFFSMDIINHIVNSQQPPGCFGFENMHLGESFKRRTKKESHTFEDGCTDHETGLGISALSIILRYLLQL